MGQNSATPKGAAAKVGRGHRRRVSGKLARQCARTYANKLRRVNWEREKAGLPPLRSLPESSKAWRLAHQK